MRDRKRGYDEVANLKAVEVGRGNPLVHVGRWAHIPGGGTKALRIRSGTSYNDGKQITKRKDYMRTHQGFRNCRDWSRWC